MMPGVTKNEASGAGGGCPLRRTLEGRDPTPHEPWPARPRGKPAVESPPYSARRRRTWRYDVGRARNGGPVIRSRVSARGAGQTNVRTFRRPPRARAGRQASPHRPLGSEPPLPRRERAVLLAERDGGAQARRPYRTGDGRPAKTGTRHRRRTAIPGKGSPPPGGAASRGRAGRTEARRTDRARRHPGAFAWQVSVARIPNVDKSKVCSDANFLCISSLLFHNLYTSSPQSYPHFARRGGCVEKNRLKARGRRRWGAPGLFPVKRRALAPCAGRCVPCRRPGNCLSLKFRRNNTRNGGFSADHFCFAPNARPWRRVTGTAALDPESSLGWI